MPVFTGFTFQSAEQWMAVLRCTCRPTSPESNETAIIHIWPTDCSVLQSYYCRRRRYRVASEGRSVAPRWPRVVARLHRSAGGIPLSFRTWSIHRSRGRPGRRFHWSLGGRPRDRSTWQWRVLCAGTSLLSALASRYFQSPPPISGTVSLHISRQHRCSRFSGSVFKTSLLALLSWLHYLTLRADILLWVT